MSEQHAFEAVSVNGQFANTCRACGCFRESANHFSAKPAMSLAERIHDALFGRPWPEAMGIISRVLAEHSEKLAEAIPDRCECTPPSPRVWSIRCPIHGPLDAPPKLRTDEEWRQKVAALEHQLAEHDAKRAEADRELVEAGERLLNRLEDINVFAGDEERILRTAIARFWQVRK